MKYVDFRKFTDENGAMPIYLFEGEEVYFREKGEQLIKSRFLQDATLDYSSFDGNTLKGDSINAAVDAVNSFPFLSQKQKKRQRARIQIQKISSCKNNQYEQLCDLTNSSAGFRASSLPTSIKSRLCATTPYTGYFAASHI